jgi:ATP-dependent DNA helicase RecG
MTINDPSALLRRLLQQRAESEWLEFKHNNSDPDEIGRCVSACANASMLAGKDRAFMVWGIENKTKRKLGTSVRLNDLKKGGENLQNWLSRMVDPCVMMEFIDFDDNNKNYCILVIDPTYDRPVKFYGKEYLRIGENIKKLSEFPEHERALWLATGRRRFESAIALLHQTESDVFDKLDIDGYYTLAGEATPKSREEILRRLQSLEFIKDDWEVGYDITNLGAILFARDISLFPSVQAKSIRVVKYVGMDKRNSEGETEWSAGYAVGFSNLMKFIMDILPKKERYRDGVRRLVPLYSEVAIREILANALIHQDFTISGSGPVVEIYKDRVEITNPGNSLIEKDDSIIDERRSRNEKMAKAMRDLGLCEERGGGID